LIEDDIGGINLFKPSFLKRIFLFLCLITIVVVLSIISGRLWGGKPEELPAPKEWQISSEMILREFGQANGLPNPVMKEIFQLQTRSDLEKKISEYGTVDQVKAMVVKKMALAAEHETKNWVKIPVKFVLWFAFLISIFMIFKNRKSTPKIRNTALFLSVLIFGVTMGSDPSPMGTVKDAIYLYGSSKAVFPPRMIALTIFLLIVFLANKYICGWGCQVGVLQDLIFRLNQGEKQKSILGKQIKVPFVISNTIRVAFLGIFTIAAFAWSVDIIAPFDPFKIFNPTHLAITGIVFISLLLIISLFIYRPWCHFFCPFGLVGWLVEKISRVKISVDYESCIACNKCANACPSTVMEAILKQDKKTIPDCFACYTCRDVCPTDSIKFSTRKRKLPPAGHFDKKSKLKK
jgi:NAD-dependent dihydropyrimidine dehydrogenase PreA subunit